MKAEWIAFGPESGRVEATDLKLDLKSEMMAIQVTVTDAKLQGQMEKHQIIILKYLEKHILYINNMLIKFIFVTNFGIVFE